MTPARAGHRLYQTVLWIERFLGKGQRGRVQGGDTLPRWRRVEGLQDTQQSHTWSVKDKIKLTATGLSVGCNGL